MYYTFPKIGEIPELRYPLTVTITPCQIDSIAATIDQLDFTYNVGDPGLSLSLATFAQEPPNCAYPATTSYDNVPSFVMTDAAGQPLSVSQFDDN